MPKAASAPFAGVCQWCKIVMLLHRVAAMSSISDSFFMIGTAKILLISKRDDVNHNRNWPVIKHFTPRSLSATDGRLHMTTVMVQSSPATPLHERCKRQTE